MKTPSEYLRSLPSFRTSAPKKTSARCASQVTRLFGHRFLYYPGSGTDIAPLSLFTKSHFVSTVVYCDYTITRRQLRQFLTSLDGWTTQTKRSFTPKDFGLSSWADFWPEHQAGQQFAQPKNAFAHFAILLDRSTRRKVNFLFLATEGTTTLARLLALGFHPAVVVVQDHGFGCNWTQFGGRSSLFESFGNNLPRLIYVGENTKAWPDYKRVSDYGPPEGSGPHPRALFRIRR
jgi:hypothetical protein